MKKTFLIGIGSVFLVAAAFTTSQAGNYVCRDFAACHQTVDGKIRYQSQGCCEDGKRQVRAFSDRIGPFQYRRPTISQTKREILDYSHPTQRHDVWYYQQYRVSRLGDRVRLQLNRMRNPQFYPRIANTIQSNTVVAHNGNYTPVVARGPFPEEQQFVNSTRNRGQKNESAFAAFEGFTPGAQYSWDMPESFRVTNNGTYEAPQSTIAFRVIRSNDGCVQNSFSACASTLGKQFKDQQSLTTIKGLENEFRWNQTVGKNFDYFPTYTEAFYANGYGTDNVYVLFTALDPTNGSVVRVESVAKAYEKEALAEVMKQVTESFRFQVM